VFEVAVMFSDAQTPWLLLSSQLWQAVALSTSAAALGGRECAVAGVHRATYLGQAAFDVGLRPRYARQLHAQRGLTSAEGESVGAARPGESCRAGRQRDRLPELRAQQQPGVCASENITATSNTDPQTGDQTGVGWGCGTFAEPKARSACLALLHCLNINECGHPGENP